MTSILRVEHAVGDFDRWRSAFDSDPAGRESGGVRRYRIMRSLEDPSLVMIDLEFDSSGPAREFLERLRALWTRVEFVVDPKAVVVELVDEQALAQAYD
jgi:hypothetical protein